MKFKLTQKEKQGFKKEVGNILSSSKQIKKEYDSKYFFNLLDKDSSRDCCFFYREEAIINFISKIINKTSCEMLLLIEHTPSNDKGIFILLLHLGKLFEDSFIKKIWSQDFLSSAETKYFLLKKGFNCLPRGQGVEFYPKIKFHKESVINLCKEKEEDSESLNNGIIKSEFYLNSDEIEIIENKILEIISSPQNIEKIYDINDFEKLCDLSDHDRLCFCRLSELIIDKIYNFLFSTDFQLAFCFQDNKSFETFKIKEKKAGILYSIFPKCFNLIINKLQFGRSNELFFEYIFNNPRKKIGAEEIKKYTKKENRIDFNKFVNNIGFKGELRKCFFDVSKTVIEFTNPLTQKDLKERNVNMLKLENQIKELKGI